MRDGNEPVTVIATGISSAIGRFFRDARASTAIEYSLIAMLIAIVLIVALTTVGSKLNTQYYDAIAAYL